VSFASDLTAWFARPPPQAGRHSGGKLPVRKVDGRGFVRATSCGVLHSWDWREETAPPRSTPVPLGQATSLLARRGFRSTTRASSSSAHSGHSWIGGPRTDPTGRRMWHRPHDLGGGFPRALPVTKADAGDCLRPTSGSAVGRVARVDGAKGNVAPAWQRRPTCDQSDVAPYGGCGGGGTPKRKRQPRRASLGSASPGSGGTRPMSARPSPC
jgi:hypothetical protein